MLGVGFRFRRDWLAPPLAVALQKPCRSLTRVRGCSGLQLCLSFVMLCWLVLKRCDMQLLADLSTRMQLARAAQHMDDCCKSCGVGMQSRSRRSAVVCKIMATTPFLASSHAHIPTALPAPRAESRPTVLGCRNPRILPQHRKGRANDRCQ
jgi:hypothetical protein